jgi:hypothetical protein
MYRDRCQNRCQNWAFFTFVLWSSWLAIKGFRKGDTNRLFLGVLGSLLLRSRGCFVFLGVGLFPLFFVRVAVVVAVVSSYLLWQGEKI